MRTFMLVVLVSLPWLLKPSSAFGQDAGRRPSVLFIVVDDMNDWISLLDPAAPARTPNLERLAKRGVVFTRAYCASPACNPSRTATLTGLRPSSSGVYGNRSDWRKALPDRKTLMQVFRHEGYRVWGAGKIFHHHLGGAFHDEASFDEFQPMIPQLYPDQKLNSAPDYGSRNTDWGAWPERQEDSIDFHTASYCVKALERLSNHQQPYFLAMGIFKPHSPFFAPAAFHDRLHDFGLPARRDDDWSDLPNGAAQLMKRTKWFWRGMQELERREPGSYRQFVRSYVACVEFADNQLGRVLDALDSDPRHANTIVVLWSDHGFHLGEKDHIEKFALWEKSNHIPLIIAAPGVSSPETGVSSPGRRCDKPVDLTAVYPTLLDLCGFPADPTCDGVSLVPLLRDPSAEWKRPALMTYQRGNHSVRSEHWRFIRYADGSEELYDHRVDPNEWNNIASSPDHEVVLRDHRRWLPAIERDPVSDLKPNR